uniref:Lysophospholipase D GDPD1-like n=1 Tax=Petromyzon marinus TaxID=7757 RepID=A0AAJ7X855_PETMA|nr:lysophospholipase D GDPD1-like [Petromyzon marinus]
MCLPLLLYVVVPLLVVYAVASIFLLKNPAVLHRKKKLHFHCRHISHRGGAGEKTENTIEAYENARQAGTHVLELDVQVTKDGVIVVAHDDDLRRATGRSQRIRDLNFDELPIYKDKLEITFDQGHFNKASKDRRIPTLREVFEKFSDLAINVEIKEDNDETINKVAELVEEFGREDRTVWASAIWEVMLKCRVANPRMPTMFATGRIYSLLLLFYTGLLPFMPLPESLFEMIMPSICYRTYIPEKGDGMLRYRWLVGFLDRLIMNKALFKHLTDRGIQVCLFVLNNDRDYRRAFELGATGVMTDYPHKLAAFLQRSTQNAQ